MRTEPVARLLSEVEPTPCPCGESRRIITAADDAVMGFHLTTISDAEAHFHRNSTEVYYVTEGSGTLILDGAAYDLHPGTVAYIPPGCVHRGEGQFTAAIVVLPPFDPADEFLAGEEPPRPATPPLVRDVADIEPRRSACGSSRRVLTQEDGLEVGLHVVRIEVAECHYHRHTTEIYHIIEGYGTLAVDDERYDIAPGLTVYVPAGLKHGGDGEFTALVICVPPFDPDDQIVV